MKHTRLFVWALIAATSPQALHGILRAVGLISGGGRSFG